MIIFCLIGLIAIVSLFVLLIVSPTQRMRPTLRVLSEKEVREALSAHFNIPTNQIVVSNRVRILKP